MSKFSLGCQRLLAGAVLVLAALTGSLLVERNLTVAQESKPAPLRHMVMFKFKDSATKAQIDKLVEEFRGLPKKIPGIIDFEYGVNNSPEGLNEGLTHCFLVTFKGEKDREVYLPHPAHKAFVDQLLPHLDKAVVVDYFVGK
ncbi:MAG: Dabb family protein [Pirellulaceae bacterium]|nr:Dabb family protein [Pirellulaceae bacterium]